MERGRRTVAENSDAGVSIGAPVTAQDPQGDTLTYSLSGQDAEFFDIDIASGLLLTNAPLDFEARSSYRVTVRVHDGRSSSGSEYNGIDAYKDVTISLTNLDEAGELSLSSTQPHVGTPLEAGVSDLDGSVSGEAWRWERSADMSAWSVISGASSASYAPVSADMGSHLRVTASYADGQGAGKSASVVSTAAVVANTAPRFPVEEPGAEEEAGDTLERMVAENADAGAQAGAPVAAVDPDGDAPTYRLSGDDAGQFDIDATTGQLRARTVFDYETRAAYEVVVSVLDSKDADGNPDTAIDDSVAVSVLVVNEAEPGRLTLSSTQPSVGSSLVAVLVDPDGVVGEVAWVWHRATNPSLIWEASWQMVRGATTSSYTPFGVGRGLQSPGDRHLRGRPRAGQEETGNLGGRCGSGARPFVPGSEVRFRPGAWRVGSKERGGDGGSGHEGGNAGRRREPQRRGHHVHARRR